jgi:ethanolamine ammonia-lyase large subunit
MKILQILLVFGLMNVGATFAQKAKKATSDYALFGSSFTSKNALSNKQMLKKYKTLKKGDTVAVKFQSTIKEVCKKKGCWMQMDLTNNKQTFVKFKDYSFFVPLDADNSEAIVNGYAFIEEVSVDDLKHYALDSKKSKEEIDKITKPEITYGFKATGVLIKK